ncbi:hypothetical protein C0J52_13032 [Blattella germanica]|nr:hypothetical protein C0J52_13032 [Blattella germanica]
MQSTTTIMRAGVRQWRAFSRCCSLSQTSQPQTRSTTQTPQVPPTPASEIPLQTPQSETEAKKFSPKIEGLVDEIAKLSLLEVGELTDLLKKRLNLPDAPVMPLGGFAPAVPASAVEDDEEVTAKKVQTSFTLKMMKFDEKQKVALIKEVKNLLEGMNLVQRYGFMRGRKPLISSGKACESCSLPCNSSLNAKRWGREQNVCPYFVFKCF